VGVSAEHPDWTRERRQPGKWDPGRSLLAALRSYQALNGRRDPFSKLRRMVAVLRHRWWSVVSGADIALNCQIDGGLVIPHPNGIVVHPDARIGPNCMIFQQVTIGAGRGGVPTIGGHVDIGAGAKVLGRITIENHAAIGANAVVLQDVPRGATAVGIPARVIVPRQG
jgi:serine O-acetyltransferase